MLCLNIILAIRLLVLRLGFLGVGRAEPRRDLGCFALLSRHGCLALLLERRCEVDGPAAFLARSFFRRHSRRGRLGQGDLFRARNTRCVGTRVALNELALPRRGRGGASGLGLGGLCRFRGRLWSLRSFGLCRGLGSRVRSSRRGPLHFALFSHHVCNLTAVRILGLFRCLESRLEVLDLSLGHLAGLGEALFRGLGLFPHGLCLARAFLGIFGGLLRGSLELRLENLLALLRCRGLCLERQARGAQTGDQLTEFGIRGTRLLEGALCRLRLGLEGLVLGTQVFDRFGPLLRVCAKFIEPLFQLFVLSCQACLGVLESLGFALRLGKIRGRGVSRGLCIGDSLG